MQIGDKENPYFNDKGYPDPTAYEAVKAESVQLDAKVNFLIKILKFIAGEAGFDIVNRIELRHRDTGRSFK